MPPKRNPQTEEVEDIKKSLDFLSEEVTAVRVQQKQLLDRQNAEKDRRIAGLEQRVDELEQYTRMNDVVITGLQIKPHSYARAVAADSAEPSEQEVRSVEQQATSYLQSKGIEMDLEHIEECHPLPMKNSERPIVIMRFVNRKNKMALLKQGRKLKGTNVFINDALNKKEC